MDITLVAISIVLLLSIVFLVIFLFNSINKKTFEADDGSLFESQTDLDIYQKLYEKTKVMFTLEEVKDSSQQILGFESTFITKLTSGGFEDLKTLFKYRKQLKSLSDLINS
tara:strand:+ start:278 stop:610 length:333 start_codon:yes stop_codon:yes gene_type:complete